MNLLILASAFSLWWVDPYGDTPYLPDAEPKGGVVTNVLSLAAAKGEYETVSFSVRPARDMKKVDFVPSDLTGPGGAKISAREADFALVKVWYRAGGRWRTSWAGNTGKPELINDLVLHDDGLIRVDEEEKSISLRIDYPHGAEYVDMRKRGAAHFDAALHPVMDAKRFVPFDLRKDRFQQYWFTWHVPADTAPGVYRGTLAVKEDGRDLEKIPVALEVYPFELPDARTHYDTSKPYVCIWMGVPSLASNLSGSKDLKVAERRTRAIYRSLVEHGMHEQAPGDFASDDFEDLSVRSLVMMQQEGMTHRLLINGSATVGSWADPHENDFISAEQNPELYAGVMGQFRRQVEAHAKVYDKYLGHRNILCYGVDECGTWVHRRSYGFYGLLHQYGFDVWSDSGIAKDIGWCIGCDDIPACSCASEAWNWHKAGSLAMTYAGPFTGPSCPDLWRRTKGLRYYYNDFDGVDEYEFYHGAYNHWNDFQAYMPYCQFQIVYLTYDGLIPTLAYEGMREGMDNVRYLSLLKLTAEKAIRSSDPKTRLLGRRHLAWMESQDPERTIDLHAFRRAVALRAAELVKVVGQPEAWKPLKPVLDLPPLKFGTSVPADADLSKLAEEYAKANRYDLAIPMWARVADDASLSVEKRYQAVLKKAGLLSEILKREEAIKTVDAALAWRELSKAQRGQLMLLRARLFMTARAYAEIFSKDQLDKAAKAVVDALKVPGVSASERYASVTKIVDAYRSGGHPQAAIDYAEARIADMELKGRDKGMLVEREAYAYLDMEEDAKAAKTFRLAKLDGAADGRETLRAWGLLAERLNDFETALNCFQKEVKMYSSEEENMKSWCMRRISRVSKNLQKASAGKELDADSMLNDSVDIQLDE